MADLCTTQVIRSMFGGVLVTSVSKIAAWKKLQRRFDSQRDLEPVLWQRKDLLLGCRPAIGALTRPCSIPLSTLMRTKVEHPSPHRAGSY